MKRPKLVCEHRDVNGVQSPGCGAPIVLVLVIPERPRKGQARKYVPLDPVYDPECGTPPSHAVSIGWTTCRPLPPGETPAPSETAALTHFATCPHRRPRP